jgi:hypothetical protein
MEKSCRFKKLSLLVHRSCYRVLNSSRLKFIALSKFEPLLLLRVIALKTRHKRQRVLLLNFEVMLPTSYRWLSTSVSMSLISNIDTSYADIGKKYAGLNPVIPILEKSRYRH